MLRSLFTNPFLWLGLGIGAFIGVASSSGLALTPQDGTRFAGALLGSLIAVAGAISLHFLKENNEKLERRKHMTHMLRQMRTYLTGLRRELDRKEFEKVTAGLIVASMYLERCQRFCAEHEASDLAISATGDRIEKLSKDHLFSLKKDGNVYSLEDQQDIRDRSATWLEYVEDSLQNLEKAGSR